MGAACGGGRSGAVIVAGQRAVSERPERSILRGMPASQDATSDTDRATTPDAPRATPAGTATDPVAPRPAAERRRTLAHTTPALLVRAAHPRQALLTATALAVAAAMSGRPGREVGLVLATVVVGQAILGWHNDLVDRERDAEAPAGQPTGRTRKPLATGLLEPGTTWFALACGVLLLIPLAISHGITAGSLYLVSVACGLLANVALRRGLLSWLPWAAAWALYPAFLSYGGWGGQALGDPPQPALVALAALLGVCVHILCALPGLVADHRRGDRHLPLRLGLRIGATRLLVLTLIAATALVAAIVAVGAEVGLRA